jgi:hypothetical protein
VPSKRKAIPIAPQTTLFEAAREKATIPRIEHPITIPGLRIGTSAFTAAGWEGSFYPTGMKSSDFLTYYATKFDTVEVDSTFYRTPAPAVVNGWERKTPDNFIFAVNVPQVLIPRFRAFLASISGLN